MAGKYSEGPEAKSCTPCGAGKYSNSTGNDAATDCMACAEGTYSSITGASCTDEDPYNPNAGDPNAGDPNTGGGGPPPFEIVDSDGDGCISQTEAQLFFGEFDFSKFLSISGSIGGPCDDQISPSEYAVAISILDLYPETQDTPPDIRSKTAMCGKWKLAPITKVLMNAPTQLFAGATICGDSLFSFGGGTIQQGHFENNNVGDMMQINLKELKNVATNGRVSYRYGHGITSTNTSVFIFGGMTYSYLHTQIIPTGRARVKARAIP